MTPTDRSLMSRLRIVLVYVLCAAAGYAAVRAIAALLQEAHA